jgi:cytochrome c551/c552
MSKTGFALCCALVAGLLAAPSAHAQAAALAKKGKTLWEYRGCGICHAVGRKNAGPDLQGVAQRRTKEWLHRWLKDTRNMLATDSIAIAMWKEWSMTPMPQQKLSDEDVDAILAYISDQESRLK